ncbi:unnamed protein product [Parajaminaea phylloscopi]
MPQRNMMSHEELSTIIHFAPIALIVLDRNRNLRRVNKLAEELLDLNPLFCTGSSFLNWAPETQRVPLSRILNDAAESAWAGSPHSTSRKPHTTVLTLQTRNTDSDAPGRQFWANLSCSTYFENTGAPPHLHEACYIVTVVPLQQAPMALTPPILSRAESSAEVDPLERPRQLRRSSRFQPQTDQQVAPEPGPVSIKATSLIEAAIYNFDFPILCMSRDGRTLARNSAMDHLLASISSDEAAASSRPCEQRWGAGGTKQVHTAPGAKVDVEWLFSGFELWDASFNARLPDTAYPIYRAAVVGERFAHIRFGAISADGQKHVIDTEGWPLFAGEGTSEFIGGMVVMKNVTRSYGRGMLETSLASATRCAPTEETNTAAEGSRDRYWYSLCQELPDISWMARSDGYLEWYSKRWYEYTGATADESLGAGWTSLVHPDDFPVVSGVWSRALSTSTAYEVQERIRDKHGQYRWMLCRAVPYKNADGQIEKWFGYLADIHNTMDTLAANREARDHLSDAVRVADITLWCIDKDGNFTLAEGNLSGVDPNTNSSSVNGSSTSLTDDNAQDHLIRNLPPTQAPIVGRSIYTEWGETTRKAIERCLAGENVVEENTIKGRTYRTIYKARRARMTAPTSFLLSDAAQDVDAPVIGVTGMSMDITERVEMERKMEESIREVLRAETAEAAATEASRMKSQFLAVISHEIRTPLNGVVGLSELLLDISALPNEAQDLVHSILRSAGALLTVINDVLDFSKVEAGKLDLVSLPFSLKLTCEDSARDFSMLMRQKGLSLVKDIQLSDELVMGDAGRITQVLNNLLGNAGKFTERGSISLVARKVDHGPLSSHYLFEVSDSGCGIPKSKLGLLFQPFRQADPSTSRRYGGSGLGLAICKNLVQLMGGEISLQSEEGVGTKVTVTIPFQPAQKPLKTPTDEFSNFVYAVPESSPSADVKMASVTCTGADCEGLSLRRSSVVAEPTTSRPRVLLAEDNPINSQIAIKNLAKLGYDVDHVENGELVLLAMERQTYDLVLMDCMMPCMDGYTATRKMRSSRHERLRKIPVIALTAAAIQGQKMCFAAGMTDYLSKPVRRATLGAMLMKWLGREHPESANGVPAVLESGTSGTATPIAGGDVVMTTATTTTTTITASPPSVLVTSFVGEGAA